MNKKLALSISQMRELKSLGVDTSNASMYYEKLPTGSVYLGISDEYKEMLFWTITDKGIEYIPALTLDDILEMLPRCVHYDDNIYQLFFAPTDIGDEWVIAYMNECDDMTHLEGSTYYSKSRLDACFELLKWCKENNYI